MDFLIVFFHIVASIALIAIVLLQTGKGAEMGAAFGGGSQTLFGGTGGASFMGKLTTGAAVLFMVTCLLLSYRSHPTTSSGRSVMEDAPVEQQTQAPPAPTLPEARPVQTEAPAAQQAAPPATPAPPASQAAPAPESTAKPQ